MPDPEERRKQQRKLLDLMSAPVKAGTQPTTAVEEQIKVLVTQSRAEKAPPLSHEDRLALGLLGRPGSPGRGPLGLPLGYTPGGAPMMETLLGPAKGTARLFGAGAEAVAALPPVEQVFKRVGLTTPEQAQSTRDILLRSGLPMLEKVKRVGIQEEERPFLQRLLLGLVTDPFLIGAGARAATKAATGALSRHFSRQIVPQAQKMLPPAPIPSTPSMGITTKPTVQRPLLQQVAPEAQKVLPPAPIPITPSMRIATEPTVQRPLLQQVAPEAQKVLPPAPIPITPSMGITTKPTVQRPLLQQVAPEAQKVLPPVRAAALTPSVGVVSDEMIRDGQKLSLYMYRTGREKGLISGQPSNIQALQAVRSTISREKSGTIGVPSRPGVPHPGAEMRALPTFKETTGLTDEFSRWATEAGLSNVDSQYARDALWLYEAKRVGLDPTDLVRKYPDSFPTTVARAAAPATRAPEAVPTAPTTARAGTAADPVTPTVQVQKKPAVAFAVRRVQPTTESIPADLAPASDAATFPPDKVEDVLSWFNTLLHSPEQLEKHVLTEAWRKQAQASRFEALEIRTAELVGKGVPYEDAMRQASVEKLSDKLPFANTGLADVITPDVAHALYKKLYFTLKNDGVAMKSTMTALGNMLVGKPIPRTLGIKGGSAFTRLVRVFGERQVLAMERGLQQDQSIRTLIAMKIAPQGVSKASRELLKSTPRDLFVHQPPLLDLETVGGVLQRSLREDPPMVTRNIPPDTRTAAGRRMDTEEFKLRLKSSPEELLRQAAISPEPAIGGTQQARLLQDPPMVIKDIPPDTRTAAGRRLDYEAYKIHFAPSPKGAGEKVTYPTLVDKVVAEQGPLMPTAQKNLLLRAARLAGLAYIDVGNLVRANKAAMDFSWWRQVAPLIFGDLKQFTIANASAFKALWSDDYAKEVYKSIGRDPVAPNRLGSLKQVYDFIKADFLRPPEGALVDSWQRAEDFMILGGERPLQRFARKLPWLRISARAHVTGTNVMTWGLFKKHASNLHKLSEKIASGEVVLKPGESFDFLKEMKLVANMLGDWSGRGPIGPLKEITPALNAGFFSFRMVSGRLFMVRSLASPSKYVRKEAWKNLVSFVGGMTGLLMAGEQIGLWEVVKDPRNPDFLKARIGRLRFDPWGGTQQFVVLMARLMTQTSISSKTLEKRATRDGVALVSRFLENKKHPFLGIMLETLEGEDFQGRPIDYSDWETYLNMVGALSLQDMWEAFEAEGFGGGLMGASGIVGMGVLAYDTPTWPEVTPYYALETNKERLSFRKRNPDIDAKLFILGRFATVESTRAKFIVRNLMDEHGIKPEHVRGYENLFPRGFPKLSPQSRQARRQTVTPPVVYENALSR